ncbi:MAG: hypothetical protein C0594_14400 [Marinilabiliales bacterium]|nr:MAG: hypothetical protein C0594_14400 [Marinilabiliales bacterium]
MTNKYIRLIFIFISVVTTSCNIYETNEILEKGNHILTKYKESFNNTKKELETVSLEDCLIYKLNTSRATDRFVFSKRTFNEDSQSFVLDEEIRLSKSKKAAIDSKIAKDIFQDIVIVKKKYMSFRLSEIRDIKKKRAKLIYCYDKESFVQLFDGSKFYSSNESNKILENENWFYFYDDNWVITTSSDMFKTSRKLCEDQ